MDTIDSSESNLPSPLPLPSRLLPALPQAFSADLDQLHLLPSSILKLSCAGLVRHWWQILLIWLVVAVPVVALIYLYVEPTFEAFSTLQVEPVSQSSLVRPRRKASTREVLRFTFKPRLAYSPPTACSVRLLRTPGSLI